MTFSDRITPMIVAGSHIRADRACSQARQSLNRIDTNNMSAIFCDTYEELNPNTIDCIMMYLIIVYKVAQKLQEKL